MLDGWVDGRTSGRVAGQVLHCYRHEHWTEQLEFTFWQCPIKVVFKVLLRKHIGTLVTKIKISEGTQRETRIKLHENLLN